MRRHALMLGLLAVTGCVRVPPLTTLPLPPVEVRQESAVPAQAPLPVALETVPAQNPVPVIEEANRAARMVPTRAAFRRGVMVYPYVDGAIYRIDAAVQQPVDIILQPGERLLGYSSGEKRWKRSLPEDMDPMHVVLMPEKANLRTRITLFTSLGIYYLDMHSHERAGLVAVRWRHQPPPEPRAITEATYGIGYGIRGEAQPSWRPVYAWDDGEQSYILFPTVMTSTAAPIVAVRQGETISLVNYTTLPGGRVYRIQRLLDGGEAFELRVNAEEEAVITVARTTAARQVRCPEDEACGVITPWMRKNYAAAK
jgi:type IV secretory pathway VirB9-like protein